MRLFLFPAVRNKLQRGLCRLAIPSFPVRRLDFSQNYHQRHQYSCCCPHTHCRLPRMKVVQSGSSLIVPKYIGRYDLEYFALMNGKTNNYPGNNGTVECERRHTPATLQLMFPSCRIAPAGRGPTQSMHINYRLSLLSSQTGKQQCK